MFGLGAGELLIIAVVMLLALGPDKLPEAAKKIGAGIRDLRKQTRNLQSTIEHDTEIGDAVRDLKYAMRGEDTPSRPKPRPVPTPVTEAQAATDPQHDASEHDASEHDEPDHDASEHDEHDPELYGPKPDEPEGSPHG